MEKPPITRYAWLSIAAAMVTIGMKATAYFLTGSVGLLSDALESAVNLAGALMALAMLTIATRPADEEHAHGHGKAEYFSSGVEGSLILIAAASIGVTAASRLVHPRPLEQIGLGLAVSVGAALVNLGVALILLRASKQYESITLRANAQHLLTDVWTSAGVLVGVGAVAITDWERLDPLVAIAVAANIVWSGFHIVADSISGLMDRALTAEDQQTIRGILEQLKPLGASYHALRTRQSGSRRFVSLHLLVPGSWTVHRGHQLAGRIESEICAALPNAEVLTHLESLNDPASWDGESPEQKKEQESTCRKDRPA